MKNPCWWLRSNPTKLLALNESLERLAQFDARQSRVVELRFFGGLTVEETAEALGMSPKTVKRDLERRPCLVVPRSEEEFPR